MNNDNTALYLGRIVNAGKRRRVTTQKCRDLSEMLLERSSDIPFIKLRTNSHPHIVQDGMTPRYAPFMSGILVPENEGYGHDLFSFIYDHGDLEHRSCIWLALFANTIFFKIRESSRRNISSSVYQGIFDAGLRFKTYPWDIQSRVSSPLDSPDIISNLEKALFPGTFLYRTDPIVNLPPFYAVDMVSYVDATRLPKNT
ncbi:MAG: hypothetical protein ACOCXT_02455 [Candidatus Dojkabacteria bacterium]